MEGVKKLWMLVFVVLFLVSNLQYYCIHGEPQVPCYFIFGDSLSDNGNNNFLETKAKVNYLPYGIDFPNGPTGRFSNGKTVVDILAELLGFENLIPSFATSSISTDILRGVNYASGAAGIRNETGSQLGDDISLGRQLINHQNTLWRIVSMQGNFGSAATYLNKCLYTVNIGSNDYLNNYFQPNYFPTNQAYTPEQYAAVLMQQYSQHLRTLYSYGARKIALFSLGPIGCTPYAIDTFGTNGRLCVDNMNSAVKFFNDGLKLLVDQLNNDLTDAKVILVSPGFPSWNKLPSHDFNIIKGCCQVSSIGQCIPNRTPCHHRNLHLFWDSFHPTEIANQIQARLAYFSLKISEAYPHNISRLVQL